MIRALVKDTIKYIPSQIIPAAVGLISIPIITRLFSPADYGNYILVLSIITVLTVIVGWLGSGIVRFYPAYERDKKLNTFYSTILKWLFVSIFIISVFFLAIILIGRNYISQNFYNLMLIGLGVFIFLSIFQTLLAFLRIKRLVGWYSNFVVWKSITAIGFGLILVIIFKLGVEGLLLGVILSIVLVIPWLWKKVVDKIHLKEKISKPLTLKMVKFSLPLIIGNLSYWILTLSDRYILEFFRGAQEVGIYSASYAIGENSILLLVSFFLLASSPIGVTIWEKKGKKESQEFVSKLTRYFLIVCLPATIGLSVLSKPIIDIFTGQEYFEGYRIFPFIALSIFFLGLSQKFGHGLGFYRKTKYIMWSLIIAGLINLELNFIFIPKYGYIAAAITTLIGYAVMLILEIYFSRKFFIWKFPLKTLIKCIFASIIMGGGIYFLVNNLHFSALVSLILGILVGVVIYSILIFLLKEILPEEKALLRQIIQKYVFKRNN